MPNDDFVVSRSLLSLPRVYIAPRDRIEGTLAKIWIEVLKMDLIGVDDDFGDLGGDSYDAAVVMELVEERLGVRVPLSSLADAPTIAALSREIMRLRTSAAR